MSLFGGGPTGEGGFGPPPGTTFSGSPFTTLGQTPSILTESAGLASVGDIPLLPTGPSGPTDDEVVITEAAALAENQRLRKKRLGLTSTILTSGEGLLTPPNTKKATLG